MLHCGAINGACKRRVNAARTKYNLLCHSQESYAIKGLYLFKFMRGNRISETHDYFL